MTEERAERRRSVKLSNFEGTLGKLLDTFSMRYDLVSLTEAKWIVLRLVRTNPGNESAFLDKYRAGLRALDSDNRMKAAQLTNDGVECVADELIMAGVKDYFDRMICGTAADLGCTLLTEDDQPLKLKRSEGPHLKVLAWKKASEGL